MTKLDKLPFPTPLNQLERRWSGRIERERDDFGGGWVTVIWPAAVLRDETLAGLISKIESSLGIADAPKSKESES